MNDKELISVEIDKYTDLLRILNANEGWRAEAENQLRKARAKLESYGVAVEPLRIDNPVPGGGSG